MVLMLKKIIAGPVRHQCVRRDSELKTKLSTFKLRKRIEIKNY